MIKQIVKKKRTINKNIEATSNRKLSIQFSLDGFSFCISNTQNEVFEFSSFNFSKTVNSPELVLDKLQEIFKQYDVELSFQQANSYAVDILYLYAFAMGKFYLLEEISALQPPTDL